MGAGGGGVGGECLSCSDWRGPSALQVNYLAGPRRGVPPVCCSLPHQVVVFVSHLFLVGSFAHAPAPGSLRAGPHLATHPFHPVLPDTRSSLAHLKNPCTPPPSFNLHRIPHRCGKSLGVKGRYDCTLHPFLLGQPSHDQDRKFQLLCPFHSGCQTEPPNRNSSSASSCPRDLFCENGANVFVRMT